MSGGNVPRSFDAGPEQDGFGSGQANWGGVWGAGFFASIMQDEAASRALEIINAQRNNLAHGRRSLSLVEIKKHVTKGLKLESWGRIPETDGEFQVLEWQPWARASSTEPGQFGLFERWQENALRYLVPETGEIFKVPRGPAVGRE